MALLCTAVRYQSGFLLGEELLLLGLRRRRSASKMISNRQTDRRRVLLLILHATFRAHITYPSFVLSRLPIGIVAPYTGTAPLVVRPYRNPPASDITTNTLPVLTQSALVRSLARTRRVWRFRCGFQAHLARTTPRW